MVVLLSLPGKREERREEMMVHYLERRFCPCSHRGLGKRDSCQRESRWISCKGS